MDEVKWAQNKEASSPSHSSGIPSAGVVIRPLYIDETLLASYGYIFCNNLNSAVNNIYLLWV